MRMTASRAGRAIAWSVAIALLVNVVAVMPLMLRMAVAGDVRMAAGCPMQGVPDKGNPGHHPVDHSHCLVCTGGIGAATLAAPIQPLGPTLAGVRVSRELPAGFPARGLVTVYISRAPPSLA